MKNNRIKTILKISLPLLVLGIAVAGWGFYYFVQKPNTTVKDNGIIYIRKGDSFETVMQALLSKRYIKNEYTLRQIARLKQYPRLVKAGRYRIQDGMSNNQLVNMLRAGNQEAVPFTFNNIRTLPDFARTANRQLGIDSAAFMSLMKDTLFLDSLGFTPATFIAMFIPNTYQIYWNTSLPAFIKRMHAEYRRFWTPERLEKAGKAGFTPIEISTIASIVEEETTVSAEYPVIAGVYINRLRKGWKMEACPTLKFALDEYETMDDSSLPIVTFFTLSSSAMISALASRIALSSSLLSTMRNSERGCLILRFDDERSARPIAMVFIVRLISFSSFSSRSESKHTG